MLLYLNGLTFEVIKIIDLIILYCAMFTLFPAKVEKQSDKVALRIQFARLQTNPFCFCMTLTEYPESFSIIVFRFKNYSLMMSSNALNAASMR